MAATEARIPNRMREAKENHQTKGFPTEDILCGLDGPPQKRTNGPVIIGHPSHVLLYKR